MNGAGGEDEAGWLRLWNAGILIGLIGLPALLGFFAGRSIDLAATASSSLPWRFVFLALGVLVGAFAAWRTLTAASRSTRPRE
jgi:NADH:ubiquinone oxidoreductase subunit 2 (subunit N)